MPLFDRWFGAAAPETQTDRQLVGQIRKYLADPKSLRPERERAGVSRAQVDLAFGSDREVKSSVDYLPTAPSYQGASAVEWYLSKTQADLYRGLLIVPPDHPQTRAERNVTSYPSLATSEAVRAGGAGDGQTAGAAEIYSRLPHTRKPARI